MHWVASWNCWPWQGVVVFGHVLTPHKNVFEALTCFPHRLGFFKPAGGHRKYAEHTMSPFLQWHQMCCRNSFLFLFCFILGGFLHKHLTDVFCRHVETVSNCEDRIVWSKTHKCIFSSHCQQVMWRKLFRQLTLDLLMNHQGKVIYFQNSWQLSQVVQQADLKWKCKGTMKVNIQINKQTRCFGKTRLNFPVLTRSMKRK